MSSLRSRFFKLEPLGFLELGKRVYRRVIEGHCPAHAAAIAYYMLLAVFPFVLFLATVVGYLPIPHLPEYVLRRAASMLPGEIYHLLLDNILALFNTKRRAILPLGLLLALWGSSNAVVCFMDAMNNLYCVKEGRPFWRARLTALLLVIGLSILFLMSLVLLMFGRKIGRVLAETADLGDVFLIVWKLMLVPTILFLLTLAVATAFFYAPDVKRKQKWVTPGSIFAVLGWICASLGFSYYINNFGSYDRTYGTFGAVIIILLWLYISGLVMLVGAAINSELERGAAVSRPVRSPSRRKAAPRR